MPQALSESDLAQYQELGYVIVKGLFRELETKGLRDAAKSDHEMDQHAYGREDGEGGKVRLSLWNHPGDGIYGLFARSQRLVEIVSDLLGDEPYHYHSKMIMKEAKVGGAWAWHQDYGYWYQNAVLKPHLVSAFIAVDPATRENGCLQVIERSHHYDRIDHVLTGNQAGADLERVAEIEKREKRIYVEMNPGDVVLFHPNLLHRSDQNLSDHPRWSMICCYNARSNSPYKESRHPAYTALDIVDDEAIETHLRSPAANSNSDMKWHSGSSGSTAETLNSEEA